MQSVIDICNKALRLINVSKIDNLSEESSEARTCSTMYAPARDALLREHQWGFARTYATLAATTLIHPHWAYVYAVPSLYLYGISVFPSDVYVSEDEIFPNRVAESVSRDAEYRFEVVNMDNSRVVLTNVPNAMLEYIRQVTDVTLFDPHFTETLCYKLAADMAIPLTGDAQIAAFYTNKLNLALQHAKVLAANEGKHVPLLRPKISSFTRARR